MFLSQSFLLRLRATAAVCLFCWAGTTIRADELLFRDDFSTPGREFTGEKPVDGTRYFNGGNSNWSRVMADAKSGVSVLQLRVGTSDNQDAIVGTTADSLGLAGRDGVRYTFVFGDREWGSDLRLQKGDVRVAVYGGAEGAPVPESFWRASHAVALVFNQNWCALVVKDGKGRTHDYSRRLWAANYNGAITRVELLLTESDYALAITGLGGTWNVEGSQAGKHGLSGETVGRARAAMELRTQSPARVPFFINLSELRVETVPWVRF